MARKRMPEEMITAYQRAQHIAALEDAMAFLQMEVDEDLDLFIREGDDDSIGALRVWAESVDESNAPAVERDLARRFLGRLDQAEEEAR